MTIGAVAQTQPVDALRRRLLVTLVAAGWPDDDIATVAGLTPRAFRVYQASDLFKTLCDEMRAVLHARTARAPIEQTRVLYGKAKRVMERYLDGEADMKGRGHDLRAAIEVHRAVIPRPAPIPPVAAAPPALDASTIAALHAAMRPVIDVESERVEPPRMPHGIRSVDEIAAELDARNGDG